MRDKNKEKKAIADYCEIVYKDKDISVKQITDRLRSMINRHLKNIGIDSQRVRVGQHSETHYQLTRIKKGLPDDERQQLEVTEAQRISAHLREWKDAILSLNLPHHLIEKNLEKAAQNLNDFIPNFSKLMSPELPVSKLRDNWKIMYKNERKGANRTAVVKALQDIKFEHHAYYLIQPIYAWTRKIATSLDREKRDRKVKTQIKVNPQFAVKTAEELITKSLENKDLANKFDLAVAIAIATGRRRTEVLKTAVFDVMDNTPEQHVIFKGQLKTHDRDLFGDVKPYPIPCLIDRKLVMDGLKLLRKLQSGDQVTYLDQRGEEIVAGVLDKPLSDQYHNNAVGQFYSHAANDRVRAIFMNPMIEFRHTRDMYSEIGYPLYKNEGEGRSAYRTRVYGHAKGQSETGRSYEKFELSTDVEKASFLKTDEKKSSCAQNKPVINALNKLTPEIEAWLRSPNAIRIHKWLIEQLEIGLPVSKISATYIRKHIMLNDVQQLNIRTINTYLSDKWINWEELKKLALPSPKEESDDNDMEEEMDTISCSEDDEIDEEPQQKTVKKINVSTVAKSVKPIKNDKPRFSIPKKLKEGWWSVIITHNNKDFDFEVGAVSSMDAMKSAWGQYEFNRTLPQKPYVRCEKINGWWFARVMHNGLTLIEIGGQASKSVYEKEALKEYQRKYSKYFI